MSLPEPYYDREGITIYHGDLFNVLPRLDLSGVTLTLTDPPYNVGLDYSGGDRRADYPDWTSRWYALVPKPLVVTPGIVNLALWLAMDKPRWVCAWYKPSQMSPSALNGFSVWEPVLVYGKHPKPIGHDAWQTAIAKQADTGDHPCPKYLPFWQKLLAAFTLPGGLVLDPFLGSGTTARAAKTLGLRCIGVEREERYCEVAARRLSQDVLPLFDGEAA